jgi:hypothetical protein
VRAQGKSSPAFSEAVERRRKQRKERKKGEEADAWVQLASERRGKER